MNKEKQLEMYYEMVLIRHTEEKAAEEYQKGNIGGFLHLYIGQESVSTGLIAARQPNDRVITAYRDHGVAINCGMPVNGVMAELFGKATGVSKGKGGSMHMASVEKNMWGGHAIVGGHLPVAAGLALGDQYAGDKNVTICMFGDGATNIGYFHEALNLSKVWNLPVLWVCENNYYGMGTTVERASAVTEIRQKAEGYGIPNKRIDGMNVMDVYEESKKAIEYVRENGPYFLEIMTYRFVGHSMGDPQRYRSQEEVKKWEDNDPIGIFRKYLSTKKIATDKVLNEIEERALTDATKAVEFAYASPDPAPEELWAHIYADPA